MSRTLAGRPDRHRRTARTPDIDKRPVLDSAAQAATRAAANAADRAVEHIQTTAECLLGFSQFLEEAKPEEIRLLGDMLAEWQNWSGSLRAGNFFRAVAERVLTEDTDKRLKGWSKDDAKLTAAEAAVRREFPAFRSGARRNGRRGGSSRLPG